MCTLHLRLAKFDTKVFLQCLHTLQQLRLSYDSSSHFFLLKSTLPTHRLLGRLTSLAYLCW